MKPRIKKIKLLLVDDHPIVREGIRARLAALDYLEIVGEAASGAEAVSKSRTLSPDIVLMDISLPGISGITATRLLHEAAPRAKVVILTAYDKREYVVESMRAGARGFLLKDASPDSLVRAIDAVSAGKTCFTTSGSTTVTREYGASSARRPQGKPLSDQERTVLALVADGATNKDIARRLGVTLRTVETYRERIMRKLDIHTVAGLTRFAVTAGIVRPG